MTIADIDNAGIAYTFFYNDYQPGNKEAHEEFLKKFKIVDKYFRGLGDIFKDYLDERPKPLYPY